MSAEAQSLVGQVLAGTYKLERLLSSGGVGTVYVGRHLRTGGLCAVKALRRESATNNEIYERFQDEARISSTLRHPHIIQVTDLDQDPVSGTPFLVMELLEGEDLHQRLESQGRLPVGHALKIARQVGSALHAAHCQGVVHRDLKPQNVFLSQQEVDDQVIETVKVLDFGLSKIRRPAQKVTRDLMVLGTPKYLCPEAAQGQNSQLDGRADQYALALILYRALSGRLPFDGDDVAEVLRRVTYEEPTPLAELVPGLPAHVVAAIERGMAKDKEDRFPSMVDFIEALTGAGDGDPGAAGGAGPGADAEAGPWVTEPGGPGGPTWSGRPSGPDGGIAWAGGPGPAAARLSSPSLLLPTVEPLSPSSRSGGFGEITGPVALSAGAAPRPFVWWRSLLAGVAGALACCLFLFLSYRLSYRSYRALPGHATRQLGEAVRLLEEADEDLHQQRFAEAARASGAVLGMSGLSPHLQEVAMRRKRHAEEEARAQAIYARFSAAAEGGHAAEALGLFAELPRDSLFRQLGQRAHEHLLTLYAETHLRQAEELRQKGLCREFYTEIQGVLALAPQNQEALSAQWKLCGEYWTEETALPPPPPRLVAYPPVRQAETIETPQSAAPGPGLGGLGGPSGPSGSGGSVDGILKEAQLAHQEGRYGKAIELAHLIVGQEGQVAWRIIGASACGLRNLKLACTAYEQLDPYSQDFLLRTCQQPIMR